MSDPVTGNPEIEQLRAQRDAAIRYLEEVKREWRREVDRVLGLHAHGCVETVQQLRSSIAAVLAIHVKDGSTPEGWLPRCAHDEMLWPCDTAAALGVKPDG